MSRTVVHFTDSSEFGGAEQMVLTVLASLDRQSWRPVLMHHPEPGIAPLVEKARDLGVRTHSVPRMPEGRRGVAQVPAFVRVLRAMRPHVFHAHLTWSMACKYGLVGAALARVPAVVATEQLYVDLSWSRLSRIKHRLIASGVDRYIAVSHEVARRLDQAFGIPARKIRVVHNGIPLDRWDRPAGMGLRARLAGPTERPIILTTARLDTQKGHCYLVEAAVRVPEALFVLAGGGPERERLETQARRLRVDDRVVFLGYRDDVPDLLASCDLFVLPSLFEGLPVSVLEAMAAGRPVITSAIGGTDEVVIHGDTGLLVPPADPAALAEAIHTVLADPGLAERLGRAGKARAHREFSAEAMIKRITDIYDECLEPSEVAHGRQS